MKNLKLLKLISAVSLFTLLGATSFSSNKVIQAKGSDTILNVTQSMAEEYMIINKNARIAVVGGGSGTGISGLINGTTDIALSSRSMKEKEIKLALDKGIDVKEIVLGFDGITIIVNDNNPIKNISKLDLGRIFRGEITNWKDLGGAPGEIVVLSRDSSSGTHEYFKEHVIREGNSTSSLEFGPKTLFLPSNESLKKEVSNNKNAIAYIGMGYLDNSVHAISIDGINASPENVKMGKYPIAREVFWYIPKDSSQEVKSFVDFALSEDGQKILSQEGFVPIK